MGNASLKYSIDNGLEPILLQRKMLYLLLVVEKSPSEKIKIKTKLDDLDQKIHSKAPEGIYQYDEI